MKGQCLPWEREEVKSPLLTEVQKPWGWGYSMFKGNCSQNFNNQAPTKILIPIPKAEIRSHHRISIIYLGSVLYVAVELNVTQFYCRILVIGMSISERTISIIPQN